MTERLGDERWLQVLRAHNSLFRRLVPDHGGYEVKNQGDGFMLVFPDPCQALECAAAIQREFAERDPVEGERVRVRMGMHAGETIREEGDFFGRSVILAARIAAQASGGEILVSEELKRRSEDGGIGFEEGRELELKGLVGHPRRLPRRLGGSARGLAGFGARVEPVVGLARGREGPAPEPGRQDAQSPSPPAPLGAAGPLDDRALRLARRSRLRRHRRQLHPRRAEHGDVGHVALGAGGRQPGAPGGEQQRRPGVHRARRSRSPTVTRRSPSTRTPRSTTSTSTSSMASAPRRSYAGVWRRRSRLTLRRATASST